MEPMSNICVQFQNEGSSVEGFKLPLHNFQISDASSRNVIITCVIVFCIWAYFYFKMTCTRTAILINRFPQGPKLPIFGSFLSLLGTPETIPKKVAKYRERYGRTVAVWAFLKPYVLIMEADPTHRILSSSKHVEKPSAYQEGRWLFGDGLNTSEGKIWKRDRKLLTPMLYNDKFEGFLKSFNHNSNNLIKTLNQLFKNGTEIHNVHPAIGFCTAKIIINLTIGNYDCINEGTYQSVITNSYLALDALKTRVVSPWMKLPIIKQIFGLQKMEDTVISILDGTVKQIIAEHKNIIENHENRETSPLLDILYGVKPEDEIKYHVATIIGAGFETTATAINFALFLLASNPENQKIVHNELDAIFIGNSQRDITFKDLADLKYLELCIKETLRLYPSAPVIARRPVEDVKLDNGLVIPKDTDVVFLLYEIHRDPTVFGEFPEKFDPDRFLPANTFIRNPAAYIPFSYGPRNCIGQKYAMMKLKTILAHILRSFSVQTTKKPEDLEIILGTVVEVVGDIPLTLTKRSTKNSVH